MLTALPNFVNPEQQRIRALRRDPTRSVIVRRAGRSIVNRKVYDLNKQLRNVLQERDYAGLKESDWPDTFQKWMEPVGSKLERSEAMIRSIVEHTLATPPDWLKDLIAQAIDRGVVQAGKDLNTALAKMNLDETNRFLTTIAGQEVRGISSETQRRILRNVARALDLEQTPNALMREVRKTLEKVTRARLIMLVNMTIVGAVNAGKLFAYKAQGVKKVGVDPEWLPKIKVHDHLFRDEDFVNVLTAGDDAVCDECEDIAAGGPYEIDEASSLIPAHPNCRCSFVPADDARFAEIEEQSEEEREEWYNERGNFFVLRTVDQTDDRIDVDAEIKKYKDNVLMHKPADRPDLPENQRKAVDAYVGGDAFKLNQSIRNDVPLTPEQQKIATGLDAAIEGDQLKQNTVLHRSFGLFEKQAGSPGMDPSKLQVGDIVVDKAFMSTSNVPLEANVKKGKKWTAVPEINILAPAGTNFTRGGPILREIILPREVPMQYIGVAKDGTKTFKILGPNDTPMLPAVKPEPIPAAKAVVPDNLAAEIAKYKDNNFDIHKTYPKMSEDERRALLLYSSPNKDEGAFFVNKKMRNDETLTAPEQKMVDNLLQLSKRTQFEEDTVLSRTIDLFHNIAQPDATVAAYKNLTPGDIVKEKAFTSTSTYSMGLDPSKQMKILAPKGADFIKGGAPEIILPPDSTFRFIGTNKDGVRVFELLKPVEEKKALAMEAAKVDPLPPPTVTKTQTVNGSVRLESMNVTEEASKRVQNAIEMIPKSHAQLLEDIPVRVMDTLKNVPKEIITADGSTRTDYAGLYVNNDFGSSIYIPTHRELDGIEGSFQFKHLEHVTLHEIGHAIDHANEWEISGSTKFRSAINTAKKSLTEQEKKTGSHWLSLEKDYKEPFAELYAYVHNNDRDKVTSYFGGLPADKVERVFSKAIKIIRDMA